MHTGIRTVILVAVLILGRVAGGAPAAQPATVDLTKAVVVGLGSQADTIERQAALMLRGELKRRTGLDLPHVTDLPAADVPAIIVGSRERMPALPAGATLPDPPMKDGKPAAEGYVLAVDTRSRTGPTVYAIGNDRRGALFAVGRLLRTADWYPGKVLLRADLSISTAPAYPNRGMQLGYRNTADTYDAWDMGRYAQYLRDLICFGNNAIELIPSVSPNVVVNDDPSWVMPSTSWDTTITVSALCNNYDMDLWMWIPLQSGAAADPAQREASLRDREDLFAACQRIDHIFVPGGDPGNTPPQLLMPYLKDLAERLRKHHPKAAMWVSPQGFSREWRDYFYNYLKTEQPDWLTGIVYGPGVGGWPADVRKITPARYPMRFYPDITHTIRCQFPILLWDEAWAQTYERQPIQPRPTWSQLICNMFSKETVGAVCYSDGTGDDVNKIVWDAMLWDPKADLREVLRDYGRCFVGPEFADDIAEGILTLEQDWVGPAISNPQVPKTLAHYQAIEKRALAPFANIPSEDRVRPHDTVAWSWRLQQQLIRAYGDAYVQKRLQRDTGLLSQAYAELKQAPQIGSEAAMVAAEKILKQADPHSAAPALRDRIEELAAMVYSSVGLQLSMEKYGASSDDRGSLLDTIDRPISDIPWVLDQFARVRAMSSDQEKLAWLHRLANWEDAGPGGFYDDLGNHTNAKDPHVVWPAGAYIGDDHWGPEAPEHGRLSWIHAASAGPTLETALHLRYTGLDPKASYVLKATYAAVGRFSGTLQLYFDDQKFESPIKSDPRKNEMHEFQVPKSATAGGTLDVKWVKIDGRSPSIAEVWLSKKSE